LIPLSSRNAFQQGIVSSWCRAFVVMAGKELRIMSRYPVDFVAGLVQVFLIVAVIVFASLMFTPSGTGASHEKLLVSGVLVYGFALFIFVSDIVWNMGYNLRKEQRQGTLEQLYLTPAPVSAMLFSRLAKSLLLTSLLCIISIWLLVALIGNLPFAHPGVALVIFTFSIASICGLGFILAALSFALKESAQTIATIVQFGFIVVCAPFFPFSALPHWVSMVSRMVPLSYSVDAFRAALMGYPPGYPELATIRAEVIIIIASGVLLPLLGLKLYRLAESHARHAGTLSGY